MRVREGGKSRSAGWGGGALWGAAAAGAFFGTAIILTIAAYVFGAMMGIAPDFPLLFSYTFMLSMLLAVVLLPVAGAAGGRISTTSASPAARLITGAAAGILMAALVWLVTAGAVTNLLDWPQLLYFLQLLMSWAVAGAFLATGISCRQLAGSGQERQQWLASAVKWLLTLLLIAILLLPLSYLPLWLAKRSFGMRALAAASEKINIPDGVNLAVRDEDVPGDAFETNRRFRAGGQWQSGGSEFSLTVDGERQGYEVEIMGMHGSIKDPSGPGAVAVDWQSASAQSETVATMLQTAREYFPVPLRYEKTTAGPDTSVYLQGDGLSVVVRTLDQYSQDAGVLYTFSVSFPHTKK